MFRFDGRLILKNCEFGVNISGILIEEKVGLKLFVVNLKVFRFIGVVKLLISIGMFGGLKVRLFVVKILLSSDFLLKYLNVIKLFVFSESVVFEVVKFVILNEVSLVVKLFVLRFVVGMGWVEG